MGIKISYTLISQVLYNGNYIDYCPRRVYWEYLSPVTFKSETEKMIEGQYFETLAIGSGRDGAAVTDLRRNAKTGEKRVVQQRIDKQVLNFKSIAKRKGIKVYNEKDFSNIQWPITMRWEKDPNIIIEIHPDIVITPYLVEDDPDNPFYTLATIDLKLTTNLQSDWGKFQWMNMDAKDKLQAHLYSYVIRNFDKEWNKKLHPELQWDELFNDKIMRLLNEKNYMFIYMIFESDKRLDHKIHGEIYDPADEFQMHESIRKAVDAYRAMARNGFPPNPNYDLCKTCPIKDKCDAANVNESYD